ncbi:RNA 2',3'-cyclic phosphodiesterase [Amycolatopsis sp. NPDC051903]|uniref:RNA 2',3'-cyclic phosphodiesterase n=1 Tax=Amycolatopsis sp. NPDC051903 TaxID=3363936 RepID=UPI0037B7837F
MRLFTALRPPADVVAEVAAALGDPAPGSGLRWSPPEDWHVTLAYYGEADEDERAAFLASALAGRPALDVRLGGPGTFPGVLWLDVVGEGLAQLAEAAGADAEERPYRAHLTLGRFPRDRRGAAESWTRRLAGFASRSWPADEVALMESAATAAPRYRVLRTFALNRA